MVRLSSSAVFYKQSLCDLWNYAYLFMNIFHFAYNMHIGYHTVGMHIFLNSTNIITSGHFHNLSHCFIYTEASLHHLAPLNHSAV